jgi:hypothetical protein
VISELEKEKHNQWWYRSFRKTTLTGRYELKEGAYEMNFNFIKRKFDIKDGSYILDRRTYRCRH